MTSFYVGQRVTVTATFAYSTGVAFDPTAFEFRIRKPDMSIVTYDQDSASVTNPAVGTYTLTYVAEASGFYTVVIESTTSPQESVQRLIFDALDPGA